MYLIINLLNFPGQEAGYVVPW